jgi:alcohol dehydrogenase class IV
MYEFFMQTRIVFGVNARKSISKEIARCREGFPKHVLLVTPGEPWCDAHLTKIEKDLLENGSVMVQYFNRIVMNPDRHCVEECIQTCRQFEIDAIVAFGGGSSIDVAKTAAKEAGIELLVTIPTTAGTGSEVSPWAVITNPETGEKQSMITKSPDLAILDPLFTFSMPPALTLYSGLDAFSHALEAYVSKAAITITDSLAKSALGLITTNILKAVENPKDVQVRSAMLEGSLLAGIAMLHAGLGFVHAVANTVGGMYHGIAHGLIIAHLLSAVMGLNKSAIPGSKLAIFSKQLDVMLKTIERLVRYIKEVEIYENDISLIVERSARNVNAFTNPKDFSFHQIEHVIRESFKVI